VNFPTFLHRGILLVLIMLQGVCEMHLKRVILLSCLGASFAGATRAQAQNNQEKWTEYLLAQLESELLMEWNVCVELEMSMADQQAMSPFQRTQRKRWLWSVAASGEQDDPEGMERLMEFLEKNETDWKVERSEYLHPDQIDRLRQLARQRFYGTHMADGGLLREQVKEELALSAEQQKAMKPSIKRPQRKSGNCDRRPRPNETSYCQRPLAN